MHPTARLHHGSPMRQTIELRRQAVHLQCTREMLELRQIADSKLDQPSRMVERYLTRLAQMLNAERVGLSVLTQKRPLTLQPSARCGVQMQPGVLETWCGHEETLARQVVEAGCLYSYDLAELKQVGVTSLMGSAVTSPLYHDGTVIGACASPAASAIARHFRSSARCMVGGNAFARHSSPAQPSGN